MLGKTDDLEKKLENLKEKYHSALYGKSSKEIIQRLEREKSNLEKKVESLKQPPIFKRIKTRLKEGVRKESLENLALVSAYTAEIYLIGQYLHNRIYSTAQKWNEACSNHAKDYTPVITVLLGTLTGGIIGRFICPYTKNDEQKVASFVILISFGFFGGAICGALYPIQCLFSNGLLGTGVGAIVGATAGGIASLTYNIIKKRDFFPIVPVAKSSAFCGLAGILGGIIGAEFFGPEGTLYGSYISSGLMIAARAKNNNL